MDEPQEPTVTPESAPREAPTEVPTDTASVSETAAEVPATPETAVESFAAPPETPMSVPAEPPVESKASSGSGSTSQVQSSSPVQPSNRPKESAAKSAQARKHKVELHLTKILAFAQEKTVIACRDVVQKIYVSPATANRYLNMLVVRSLLVRVGKGRSVTYKIQ